MVLQHDVGGAGQKLHSGQQAVSQPRVGLHLGPLFGGQRLGFVDQAVADADLSDVVQQRAILEVDEVVTVQANLGGDSACVPGDAVRVRA